MSESNRGFFDDALDDMDEYRPENQKDTRKSKIKSLIAVLVSLAVLLGGGFIVYSKAVSYWRSTTAVDYPGPGQRDVVVTIKEGSLAGDMAATLFEADVVASEKAFMNAAKADPNSSKIQAGSYKLKTKLPAKEALAMLLDVNNMVRNQVTLREGLRNSQVVAELSKTTGLKPEDFETVLANPDGLGLPDYAQGNSEGYLFPETYEYSAEPDATQLLAQMVKQFGVIAEELKLQEKAEELGVSPHDIVVVASIIEKENRVPEHAPDVAQVIYNRLAQGMKLQMDSTVHYAVNDSGETVQTTEEQRQTDSPYNTYKYEGLPPGAISNPGRTALEAALNPTKGKWLYFVTVNLDTGETKFAETYEEHEKNVAEYSQWCAANKGKC